MSEEKVESRGPAGGQVERSEHVVTRHRGLLKRTFLVSGLTLASRLLGFVREVQSAALFGSESALFDAFLTAWRVPNLFRRFFGEGALSTSLQTALTERDADAGDASGRALFLATLRVTTVVLVGLSVVSGAALLFAPGLVESGLLGEPAGAQAAVELAVRVLPFMLLVCLAALTAGALQVRGEFLAPALAPVAMNVVWILALVWISIALDGWEELDQLRFLAGGVVVAGLAQLLIQVPALRRHGLWGSPLDGRWSEGWSVLWASAPFALGAAAYQVNVLVGGLMAEMFLADGGPTAHYYANRVQQFPLALIAIAATSAVFPSFKALGHLRRLEELRSLHDRTQRAVLFLALPCVVGLGVLSLPIARALFEHGEFTPEGTGRVARALAIMALALPAAGAVGLTSRLYYALGDIATPVRLSVVALVLNVGLDAYFLIGLDLDVEGLAWAAVIATWVNWLVLLPGLSSRLGLPPGESGGRRKLVGLGACAAATGAGALLGKWGGALAGPALGGDLLADVGVVVLGIVGGALGFLLAAQLLDVPEWRRLRDRFTRGR